MNEGIYKDLTSKEYHEAKGSYSSSQLKDILEDPEYFYKKHILKEIEKPEIPAFDIGTYFHTALLEPDKMDAETAVFEGIRRGKEWEAFKEKHKNKAIITKTEREQAENLISAVKNSPIAMGRLIRGVAEVSCFVNLKVAGNDIYHPTSKTVYSPLGFVATKTVPKAGIDIVFKVRADLLGSDFILDLKSTTGNAKAEYKMRSKIAEYQYDLSAAMYLDLFNLVLDKKVNEFVWVFASKDYVNSKTYIASQNMIQVGRAKFKKAVLSLAEGLETDWQFEDSISIVSPLPYEMEWIKPKDADLI